MANEDVIEREVRFAVVIYGGVSLAIYINGVVQEMLHLTRSTHVDVNQLTGVEKVYRKLACLVGRPAATEGATPDQAAKTRRTRRPSRADLTDTTVRLLRSQGDDQGLSSIDDRCVPKTKFTIDILSGTSAGGINAIYLAKALSTGASLKSLAKLWITEADISKLLNDEKVDPGELKQKPPSSLLNGPWMYYKLLLALQDMSKEAETLTSQDSLVEDLDLFCTATDLDGTPVLLPLTDKGVFERRYRSDFHFVRRAGLRGPVRDDMKHAMDPFLAFAARCTSSFPIAFEPMMLKDLEKIFRDTRDKDLKQYQPRSQADPQNAQIFGTPSEVGTFYGADAFEKTCRIYSGKDAREQVPFPSRAFADGGYLHNKPFSYAIQTLMKRSALVPVDRKLIYIEPEPERISPESDPSVPRNSNGRIVRQNALQNGLDALVVLPRYQTIREDIQSVIEWNNNIARIRRVVDDLEEGIKEEAARASANTAVSGWRNRLAFKNYFRLRLSSSVDQLAAILADSMNVDTSSVEGTALRIIAGKWRDTEFGGHDVVKADPHNQRLQQSFLDLFDFEFVGRALRYLRTRLLDASNADRSLDTSSIAEPLVNLTRRYEQLINEPPAINLGNGIDPRLQTIVYPSWLACMKFIIDPIVARWLLESIGEKGLEELLSATDDGTAARVDWLYEHPGFPVGFVLDGTVASHVIESVGLKPSQFDLWWDGELGCKARSKWLQTDQSEKAKIAEILPAIGFGSIKEKVSRQLRAFFGVDGGRATKIDDLLGSKAAGAPAASLLRSFAEFDQLLKQPVGTAWREFEVQDSLVFPIIFGTNLGEFETVDIFRISPKDAGSVPNVPQLNKKASAKLKGSSLMAFGGFLDQTWRLSDMLRGRLDGADRLITAILPDTDTTTVKLREMLIREAQEAIATEWREFETELGLARQEQGDVGLLKRIRRFVEGEKDHANTGN